MRRNLQSRLLAILALCFVFQAVIQRTVLFDRWCKDFAPKKSGVPTGVDPAQLLFVISGFREMIAGILWVRADSFFDTGNYDAILPIIRIVTLLDPKEIDVFATGMWHIGYNFTDEEQRSDRRYIPSALALGKEGCRQNPETYEMFFETGWMWYHKIDDDYQQAVKWFTEAQTKPDMLPARKNLLAMAYQRDGKPVDSLNTYFRLYDDAVGKLKSDTAFGNRQNRDTLENNIDTNLVRLVQRGWVAEHPDISGSAWHQSRPLTDYDAFPPFDVGFSVKATVVAKRVMRFEGTWNVLPVGTRIRVVLKDANYPHGVPAGMDWDYSNDVNLDPPTATTFMQDQLFVRNRRFNHKVDMSKDPTMYPMTAQTYELEFFYDPRSAPPHIQDKFSWNGEGMTDKNFLNGDVRKGHNVIFWKTTLTKDQLLREGVWQDRVPVVKTPNYAEGQNNYDKDTTIIEIPSLRSSK